jgi:hypothetical protein
MVPDPDPKIHASDCCGSGMFIPDPKTVTKERGEKKFVMVLLFVVTNFTLLNIMLFFNF